MMRPTLPVRCRLARESRAQDRRERRGRLRGMSRLLGER